MNSDFRPPDRRSGFSLTELLIVVAIIGVTTLITVPLLADLRSRANEAVARQNAQRIVSVSQQLSAVGVAHVLPDSLGGVEATVRLLRRGITVTDGSFAGRFFTIGQIADQDIKAAAVYRRIAFEQSELQLTYDPNPVP